LGLGISVQKWVIGGQYNARITSSDRNGNVYYVIRIEKWQMVIRKKGNG
jgi:hypothetical protein